MMASKGINKVILVGNLGEDPDVRYTPNGKAVANLSIATSESWKDQQGQVQERTEWHRVVLWGKTAEVAGEYLRKGSQVYIEGKLQTRKWQDQQGQDRYTTEIVVQGFEDKMQMLGGGGARQSENGFQPHRQQPQQNQGKGPQSHGKNGQQNQHQPQGDQKSQGFQQMPPQHQSQPMAEPDFDFDDDIPFAPIGKPFNNNYIHSI